MSESLEEKEMLWELKAKGEFFFFTAFSCSFKLSVEF